MAGKDWNKEVGTWKGADKPGGVDYNKRMEFYMDRSKFKLNQNFDDVINDLTAKGFKTMDDLKSVGMPTHEIKAGDTLFPILKSFFLDKFKDKGMTPDQAEKEAYLSLAFVMKNNAGINVDDLKVGGEIIIDGGYLSVVAPDKKFTINRAALRPVIASAAPESAPVTPPHAVGGRSKNEGPVAPEPAPVFKDKNDVIKSAPVEGRSKREGPVAPAPEVQSETKVLTQADLDGKYTGNAQYTDPHKNQYIGEFKDGEFVRGLMIDSSGEKETGFFDGGGLLQGVRSRTDGIQESGRFEDNWKLIDGVRTGDGKVEYVFPEEKLAKIEARAANLKPKDGENTAPYFNSGSIVKFRDGYFGLSSTPLDIVENPEKAKQLADKLNERYKPVEVAPVAPAPEVAPERTPGVTDPIVVPGEPVSPNKPEGAPEVP